jgi:hypothetical protein
MYGIHVSKENPMNRDFVLRLRDRRFSAAIVATLAATAFAATPPRNMPAPGAQAPAAFVMKTADEPPVPTATAVVVKSWSGCGSDEVVWNALNRDGAQFGDVRVRIAYHDRALCDRASEVTYDALEASGAQTVILSDPAGGGAQFDASEIDAITRYVQEGHNLVATFLTLQYTDIDNRGLAPLFGLDAAVTYGRRKSASGSYTLRPHAPLFAGLGGQYDTGGYLASQKPPGGHWTNAAADEGRILAFDVDRKAAILQYCGAGFRSILFTQMPEYHGNAQDQQVLYNAIVMGRKPGCRHE